MIFKAEEYAKKQTIIKRPASKVLLHALGSLFTLKDGYSIPP
jgi:hypothetical protein